MSGERRTTTSQPARLSPEDIATRAFSSAFRGVSEQEVRSFLRRVSEELQAAHVREQELRSQLDELHERLRTPKPLDESELLAALGEETAQLLRSAREAAKDIRVKAEEAASRLRHDAQQDAEKLREEAAEILDVRTREADHVVAEIVAKAEAEVAELRATAEAEVAALRERTDREVAEQREHAGRAAAAEIEAAKAQGRALHEQARAVRERVLADLTHRRDLLQAQIAELRVGREHLVEAYRAVKRTFLDATEALTTVEVRFAQERPESVDPTEIEALLADDALDRAGEDLGEDLERDHEPTAPVGMDAVEMDAAETKAVETDAVETDAVETDAVEADAAETNAVETNGATTADTPPVVGYVPPGETPARDVDQLFARIRAEATPPATDVVDITREERTTDADAPTAEAAPAGSGPVDEGPATDEPTVEERAAQDGPADESPAEAVDHALRALLAAATRRAKRLAQDEQNAVLDLLRRQKGRPTSAAVLASEGDQRAAWADALGAWVSEAYLGSGATAVPDGLAAELAAVVFEPLRAKVVDAIDRGDDDGITERVNARYREWKLQSMEGAVLDVLAAAHARGVYDSAGGDARLAWLVATDGCCPDCSDNALEPVRKGKSFPTGTAYPPAHVGCRCTLAVLATTAST